MYILCWLVGLFLFGFGFLIVLCGYPLLGAAVLALCIALLLYTSKLKKLSEKQAADAAALAIQQQLQAIKDKTWAKDQRFIAPCRSVFGIGFLFLIATFLAFFVWQGSHSWLAGTVLLGFAALFLSLCYRGITYAGTRFMVLSRAGVSGCGWGVIPWQAIDSLGLFYGEISGRGEVFGHIIYMDFLVPTIQPYVRQMHWLRRLYFSVRGVPTLTRIRFRLKKTAYAPGSIKEVARELWKQSTGLTHDYIPGASAEFNRSLRDDDAILREWRAQSDAQIDELKRIMDLADSDAAAADKALISLKAQSAPPSIAELTLRLERNAASRNAARAQTGVQLLVVGVVFTAFVIWYQLG